jgi:hypothetical protein
MQAAAMATYDWPRNKLRVSPGPVPGAMLKWFFGRPLRQLPESATISEKGRFSPVEHLAPTNRLPPQIADFCFGFELSSQQVEEDVLPGHVGLSQEPG